MFFKNRSWGSRAAALLCLLLLGQSWAAPLNKVSAFNLQLGQSEKEAKHRLGVQDELPALPSWLGTMLLAPGGCVYIVGGKVEAIDSDHLELGGHVALQRMASRTLVQQKLGSPLEKRGDTWVYPQLLFVKFGPTGAAFDYHLGHDPLGVRFTIHKVYEGMQASRLPTGRTVQNRISYDWGFVLLNTDKTRVLYVEGDQLELDGETLWDKTESSIPEIPLATVLSASATQRSYTGGIKARLSKGRLVSVSLGIAK